MMEHMTACSRKSVCKSRHVAFAGSIILMSAMSCAADVLPDADEDDAFVEATGTQYVNLRHRTTPSTRVWLDFRATTTDTGVCYLGTDGATDASHFSIGADANGAFYFKHGPSTNTKWVRMRISSTDFCAVDTKRHTIDVALNADADSATHFVFTTDGETNYTWRTSALNPPDLGTNRHCLALFARMSDYPNGFSAAAASKARVYGVKIWEGDTLVHDYVPRKVEGRFYLKDLVDGAYVTTDPRASIGNVAASKLAGGGRIGEDLGDAYLESDGKQWIDLGFAGKPNMKAELDYAFVDTAFSEQYLFGCSGSNEGGFTFMGFSHSSGKLGYGCESGKVAWSYFLDTADSRAGIKYSTARRTLVLDAPGDAVAYLTAGFTNSVVSPLPNEHASGVTPLNCHLFTAPNNTAPRALCAKMKFYGLKIYEDGRLVKHFVPYVRDGLAGVVDKKNIADFRFNGQSLTNNPFVAVGGDVEMAEGTNDQYLESDGSQYLNLGYKATATTRVEIDFSTRRPFINGDAAWFGARGDGLDFWGGASKHRLGFTCGASSWVGLNESNGKINLGRMKLVFDAKNKSVACTQGGKTVFSCGLGTVEGKSNLDMFLFVVNKNGTAYSGLPLPLRIYSFKIYENDELKHAFYPYCQGNVIGLRDTETGAIKTDCANSATPFKVRGCSRDGESFTFETLPAANYSVEPSDSVTVSVTAPNTDRFVWRKNGRVIEGETTGTLTIPWERTSATAAYTVAPVYTINPADGFVDRDVEAASAAFTVTNLPRRSVVIIR